MAGQNRYSPAISPLPTTARWLVLGHRGSPGRSSCTCSASVRPTLSCSPNWPTSRTCAGPASQAAGLTAAPRRIITRLDPQTVARIDALAAAAGTTRFVALLAQWAPAIAEVTGQNDFAVGVPVAQRDGAALNDVVGCHIGMVDIR